MNDNNGKWITSNGTHIFIEEGSTFNDSVQNLNLYHGTNADFDEFSLDNFGQRDAGDFGKAIYLTKDINKARVYGNNVLENEVKVKNPYLIKNSDDYNKLWNQVAQFVDKSRLDEIDLQIVNDESIPQADRDFILYDKLSSDEKKDIIKSLGYDSIIDDHYGQVAVFDVENIKTTNKRK